MKPFIIITLLLPLVHAFPHLDMTNSAAQHLQKMRAQKRADNASQAISQAETNCGPTPCLGFDPVAQLVSTTGQHAYASPAADQLRGPCPGLNAAANHGYLPRSGVVTYNQAITGLSAVYNMPVDLISILAVLAIIFAGDPITQTFSIGGPMQNVALSLGYQPQGISYSHNDFEGDASVGRGDAYMNNGDAHSLDIERFSYMISLGLDDDRYTFDIMRQGTARNQYFSVANNPYYFAPPVAGTVAATGAAYLITGFMSNHSADEPSGYLDGDTYKSFFAVSGDYPNLTWLRGQERIPDNWYKRPVSSPYTLAQIIADLGIGWTAYPNTFRMGGNVNGVNSYQGVDVGILSGGTYTPQNLFEGNNFACLLFQTQNEAFPDFIKGLVNGAAEALLLFDQYILPVVSQFDCPPLAGYDPSVFNAYPGRTYNPSGPDNNY